MLFLALLFVNLEGISPLKCGLQNGLDIQGDMVFSIVGSGVDRSRVIVISIPNSIQQHFPRLFGAHNSNQLGYVLECYSRSDSVYRALPLWRELVGKYTL